MLVGRHRGAYLLARRLGAEWVLAGEVEERRALDCSHLAELLLQADRVVADRRVDVNARRRQVGELATQAKPDCANLSIAFGPRAQRLDRGVDILDRALDIEALEVIESLLEVGLRVVELNARLQPPEKIGCQRDPSLLGVKVGQPPHMMVDAEDFLQKDQARARTGRRHGQVSREIAAGGGNGDHLSSHRAPSRWTIAWSPEKSITNGKAKLSNFCALKPITSL
jgi:hypothetical protein